MSNTGPNEILDPARAGWFATTHWSVVLKAGQTPAQEATEALNKLCRSYWYPLYVFIRRSGHDEEMAKDLTQGFFEQFLAKNYLGHVDPEKGKFRSFLLASVKHFLSNQRDRAATRKRGGDYAFVPWDEATLEN